MYQPRLRPDQVRSLYFLKEATRRPMTHLIREAVDRYLEERKVGVVPSEKGERERPGVLGGSI